MIRLGSFLGQLRRSWRREDGNATIEFVLLFPALMTLFLIVFETGVMLTRGVMLDRGVDIAMRELRLGTLNPMTHGGLKDKICQQSAIIPNCINTVFLELRKISTTTWEPLSQTATCVNRALPIDPSLDFRQLDGGASNEMMLVRVCAVFDPYFPTSGLAAQMKVSGKLDDTNGYALVTTSAYVNEP